MRVRGTPAIRRDCSLLNYETHKTRESEKPPLPQAYPVTPYAYPHYHNMDNHTWSPGRPQEVRSNCLTPSPQDTEARSPPASVLPLSPCLRATVVNFSFPLPAPTPSFGLENHAEHMSYSCVSALEHQFFKQPGARGGDSWHGLHTLMA